MEKLVVPRSRIEGGSVDPRGGDGLQVSSVQSSKRGK